MEVIDPKQTVGSADTNDSNENKAVLELSNLEQVNSCLEKVNFPLTIHPQDEKSSDNDDIDWSQVAKTLKERLAFACFKTQHGWQDYDIATCEQKLHEELQSKRNRRSTLSASFAPSDSGTTNGIISIFQKSPQISFDVPRALRQKTSKKQRKRTLKDDHIHSSKKAKRHLSPPPPSIELGEELIGNSHQTRRNNVLPASSVTMLSQFGIDGEPTLQPPFSNGWGAADPMLSDNYVRMQGLTSLEPGTTSPPSTPPHQQPQTPTDEHAAELLYFFASSPVATSPARTPVSRFLDTHLGYTTPPHRTAADSSTPKSAFSLSDFINITPTPKSPFSFNECINATPTSSRLTSGKPEKHNFPPLASKSSTKTTLPPLGDRQTINSSTPPAMSISFDEYVNSPSRTRTPTNTTPLFNDFLLASPPQTKSSTTNSFSPNTQLNLSSATRDS